MCKREQILDVKTEYILVFYDEPIFFIGLDAEGKRLAFLTIDDNLYLCFETSAEEVLDVLEGRITPYDFFRNKESLMRGSFSADSDNFIINDIVQSDSVDDKDLPEKGYHLLENRKAIAFYKDIVANDNLRRSFCTEYLPPAIDYPVIKGNMQKWSSGRITKGIDYDYCA